VIEGHTDSKPVVSGQYPSNWELSSARASRVVRSFVDRGFDPKQMAALGYADTRPVEESRSPDGKWNEDSLSKNRRVVVRIFHERQSQKPTELAAAGEGSPPPSAERAPASEAPVSELEMARRSAERVRAAFQKQP